MRPTEDQAVWISAEEALRAVEGRFGGAVLAKAELADRLRDGRLKAFAEKKWPCRGDDVGDAFRAEPDIDDEDIELEVNLEVRESLWRWSACWAQDQSDWRWQGGKFVLTYDVEDLDRIMLTGVQFQKEQIEALARGDLDNDGFPDMDNSVPPVRRGRKPEIKARYRTFQKILELEFAGELITYKTQDSLLNALEDADLGLKKRALQPLVSEIWPTLSARLDNA